MNNITNEVAMSWKTKLLRKFFLVKEIRSRKGMLHFERWRILNVWLFAIYIHKIYRSDEDIHQHSHPWIFFSKILTGGYIEQRGGRGDLMTQGSWTIMKPKEYHKITVIKPTTSFVITGPRLHKWGYMTSEGHVDSVAYRERKRKNVTH